jgi:hypothetical protein
MNQETIQLPVIRYRDDDGKPTCMSRAGQCQFLQWSHFGTQYHCFWAKHGSDQEIYARGDDRRGSLIPINECPLWEGEEWRDD